MINRYQLFSYYLNMPIVFSKLNFYHSNKKPLTLNKIDYCEGRYDFVLSGFRIDTGTINHTYIWVCMEVTEYFDYYFIQNDYLYYDEKLECHYLKKLVYSPKFSLYVDIINMT
ncbi:MAG: hypothetical protein PHT03_05800 [Bacilli bacterium]|nr:hypothetical protein [Bacilli bacterium]